MNLSTFFKKNWIHFAAIAFFFILMFVYFAPEFKGYALKQHDVEQFKGMSHETEMFREQFGEEPLWTNSMFGGMPTTQISTLYNGNIFQKIIIGFLGFVGVPSGIFLLHLLGFYILALCLRIKPVVAIVGAIAFAFASYEIVILQAGHNSKATAVAFMAPVVGAFIMAYRNNWKWGVGLSALFMSFQLASNHLQVTYYMAFLLLGLGVYELVNTFVAKKDIKRFVLTSGGLIGAYILAIMINWGNITITQDYAKHTIRGGNDITINVDGSKLDEKQTGLDKEYITNWSYGIEESFTLLSPFVKGSATVGFSDPRYVPFVEDSDLTFAEQKQVMQAPYPVYWGDQPITSGPVYVGVIMMFIMLLGLVFLKDNRKWVLFGIGVLALMLSWGKNFMGLTDFFIDNIPGYNKFRTVTIILVLIELIVPIIAVLFLNMLLTKRDELVVQKKKFLITSGAFIVFLVVMKVAGDGSSYTSQNERDQLDNLPQMVMENIINMPPQQRAEYGIDLNNQQQMSLIIDNQVKQYEEQLAKVKIVREDMYNLSWNRSILLSFLAIGALALVFFTSLPSIVSVLAIGLFVLLDLVFVDLYYLNGNEDASGNNLLLWEERIKKDYPLIPTQADKEILTKEITNAKVSESVTMWGGKGKALADELGVTGVDKNRVISSYQFSGLNFATNYRVFEIPGTWSSTRASYFHKSIGGYHGAKLRNIQNLFEFHISRSNNKVLDMMNIKYIIQNGQVRENITNLGPVWMVENIKKVANPTDAILALGKEFELTNLGTGELIVNGEKVQTQKVYDAIPVQYVINNDTTDIRLPNGLGEGVAIHFAEDANGVKDYVMAEGIKNDSLNSFKSYVNIQVTNDFIPSKQAVLIDEDAAGLENSYSGKGEVKLTSYLPNQMTYSFNSSEKQFVVFSEMYYPEGWTLTIDGKSAEIRKVNYGLRGVEVEKGNHEIKMVFDIPKLGTTNMMAIICTIILVGGLGFIYFKEKKEA